MNDLLKVVIIDDEADARMAMQIILANFSQVRLIGET
jgi:hypothetical protein